MDNDQLKNPIEAALLAYGQPLNVEQLRERLAKARAGDGGCPSGRCRREGSIGPLVCKTDVIG